MCELMKGSTSQGDLPTFEEARGVSTRGQASERLPPQARGRREAVTSDRMPA
jgi:hypothetical protein